MSPQYIRAMGSALAIGSISSLNASLVVAVFDARSATDWVPTKPAATKAQFTGHPAEVMRGLAKGEEATPIDVGGSSGFAFELEGKSGKLEAYRLDDGTLALIAPPRASRQDAELFDEMLASTGDATEIGELELTSGKLAIVYLWHKRVGAAGDLAVPAGGAVELADGYGEGNGGLVVDLGAGTYRLLRRELSSSDDGMLVAMYFSR